MTALIVIGLLGLVLLGLVFVTKRRFGLLGLALAAGAILAELWASDMTPFIAGVGINLVAPPLESVVAMAITLLPALWLLFSGKKVNSVIGRVISGLAFVLLAIMLTLDHLLASLVIEGAAETVFDVLVQYRAVIVTGLLGFAILDLFGESKSKPAKGAK